MKKTPISHLFGKILLLLTLTIPSVFGQIKIDFPAERSVYQRDLAGYSEIQISGTYQGDLDKIEVRASSVYPGQGVDQDWTVVSNNPKGGVFSGKIKLFGGWYTLIFRGTLAGKEVMQASVSRTGVGEVFVIAGQSNVQGLRNYPLGQPAQDDRVSYINNNENTHNSLADPNPPTFSQLSTRDASINPRGQGAWCWGTLGDMLVSRLNVPVLFINAAWEGTAVNNWAESANNQPTTNWYGGFNYPQGMPYANLSISVRHYANLLGMRSVLWMQGETDTHPAHTSREAYKGHLQFLINKLGADVGKRVYWTIARTSRTSTHNSPGTSLTSDDVVNAQTDVVNTPFNPVWGGPITDHLANPRIDGIHFATTDAMQLLAKSWNDVMTNSYFTSVTPILSAPIPSIEATCVNNESITLSLPDGYSTYQWSNGASGKTINVTSPGNYYAVLKDGNNNSIRTSTVVINDIRPSKPSILPEGPQQACANSEIILSANGNHTYSWYTEDNQALGTSKTLTATTSGSYKVRATNAFGCTSELSDAKSVTIHPQVAAPIVMNSGPFSVKAVVENIATPMTFEWYNDNVLLANQQTELYKVSGLENGQSAHLTAKAHAVFTIAGTSNSITCTSALSEAFTYTRNANEEIVVFPNPAPSNQIYVESRDQLVDVSFELFDLYGRLVATDYFGVLNKREKINAPILPRGTYILRIKSGTFEDTKKIIVY